ncbi:MAG TPA: hypothetical protein PKA14_25435 [Leptospiraceae bacterium]|nr:hypothetical protein [Leptospiraceae bacterium]
MKKNLYLLAMLSVTNLYSYEGDGAESIMIECDTVDKKVVYSTTQTKITFYGDSRMDFVNNRGVYGNNTMDTILNEPYENNSPYSADQTFAFEEIQNFGVNGYRSYNVLGHLENCIPKLSEQYKIGKRFVFHVGGNNFMDSVIASAHALQYLHCCRHSSESHLSSSFSARTYQHPISKCIPNQGSEIEVV